jgi:hypothetical protein
MMGLAGNDFHGLTTGERCDITHHDLFALIQPVSDHALFANTITQRHCALLQSPVRQHKKMTAAGFLKYC